MIKSIYVLLGFVSIFNMTAMNVFAEGQENRSNTETIYGVWNEDSGSWSNHKKLATSKKPQRHWGVITQKSAGGVVYSIVTAHTEWKGVYHYSRARFEGVFGVEGDSGRVYGFSKTRASSGWVDKIFSVAKTYWGK